MNLDMRNVVEAATAVDSITTGGDDSIVFVFIVLAMFALLTLTVFLPLCPIGSDLPLEEPN